MATKVKSVKVLCSPDTFFSIGNRTVAVGELTIEQAELVAAQHPGRYVEITDHRVAEKKAVIVSPATGDDKAEATIKA